MMYHIETRDETLIVTDLENNTFKILANTPLNQLKYKAHYLNRPIEIDINGYRIEETEANSNVFVLRWKTHEFTTSVYENELIGEVVYKALFGDLEESKKIIIAIVQTKIGKVIRTELLEYLLQHYLVHERVKIFPNYVEIDEQFRVYTDRNYTEVVNKNRIGFRYLCLQPKNYDMKLYKPQYFKINNEYFILDNFGCLALSKIYFLLDFEKHKNDRVFWRQVTHLIK